MPTHTCRSEKQVVRVPLAVKAAKFCSVENQLRPKSNRRSFAALRMTNSLNCRALPWSGHAQGTQDDGFKSKTAEFANQRISRHDMNMTDQLSTASPAALLRNLAEFRFELRRFLQFSESAAVSAGLQPKQHQLLLQVAGAGDGIAVTIAYAADRLGLKHNSAVELVNRSEQEGLLARRTDVGDRRRALLQVTRKGERLLNRLAADHARELNELAPRLVEVLEQITLHASTTSGEAP